MRIKTFENFTGIEKKSRLSDKITKLLNEQIKQELESSQIYKSMASWLDENGWIGAKKYFFKSGQEELVHMDKLYEYLYSKNARAITPASDKPVEGYNNIRNVVEMSLEHEMQITKLWNNIANSAKDEDDNDTYTLAQWYLTEQIEEESKFRDILFKMNLDMPNWEIDDLFNDLNG